MLAWFEEGRRIRWLLPLVLGVALALVIVTEASYQSSTSSLKSLASRSQARSAISTVMRRLLDAETAQRGYLITNRKEYLTPLDEADRDIAQAVRVLERHYAQDAAALAQVRALHARAQEKMSELTATMRLFDSGAHDRWRDLMFTNIGKEKMDAVRSAIEQLMAGEDRLVVLERNSIFDTLAWNRWGVYALVALTVFGAALYAGQTSKLVAARERHALDLQAERDELENQVRFRTQELTELARHLQSAREDERSRLARELHDELGALLTAAKLDVARLKRALAPLPEDVGVRLAHLVATIDQGVALKRRVIEDLRPSSLSNLGLVAALDIQAREFAQRSGIAVQATLEPVRLSEMAQITAYRVVQESLTNIAKYAEAKSVQVRLAPDGPRVQLEVRDDGRGFDPLRRPTGSHGLTGMRYRLEAAGGELSVQSAPGKGTRVQAWLPVDDEAQAR